MQPDSPAWLNTLNLLTHAFVSVFSVIATLLVGSWNRKRPWDREKVEAERKALELQSAIASGKAISELTEEMIEAAETIKRLQAENFSLQSEVDNWKEWYRMGNGKLPPYRK